ncbi:hypothetical protein DL240_19310 [Lujinxingia litoralis]|uniref:Abnormal spindle-like microcephaly-associated protein ASH domain-containing protein n=1 Tax=Lujinxingia litoralis TaxID=2211119 RepID=A0A328C4Q3_9DELT|nr:choice-of-anchor D domain-containing protein [Lujinxingia litoralis]RAL20000.1 hypothetical protein DL240_19310 [Lujinxingia litoralis]
MYLYAPRLASAPLALLICCALSACGEKGSDTAAPATTPDVELEEDTGPDATEDTGPEDTTPAGPPNLDTSPLSIAFSDVRLGEEQSAIITIRNTGESPLAVTQLRIEHFQLRGSVPQFRPGEGWEQGFTLAPNTYRDVVVRWVPTLYTGISGRVIIGSDDPDTPELIIPLQATSAYPVAEAPRRINFGTVPPGQTAHQRVTIYNRGLDPLNITGFASTGDPEFAAQFSGRAIEPPVPAFLQHNDKIEVELSFTASSDELVTGAISMLANLPEEPDIVFDVQANGPTPCIQTDGDVDFGEFVTGTTATKELLIANCSRNRSLTLSQVELLNDAGGVFELVETPALPWSLGIAQSGTLQLRATLPTEQEAVGQLKLVSDDPTQSEVVLQLRARPTDPL